MSLLIAHIIGESLVPFLLTLLISKFFFKNTKPEGLAPALTICFALTLFWGIDTGDYLISLLKSSLGSIAAGLFIFIRAKN